MKKMRKAYQLTDEILSPILVQYRFSKRCDSQYSVKIENSSQLHL
jgi:hypothetical protein